MFRSPVSFFSHQANFMNVFTDDGFILQLFHRTTLNSWMDRKKQAETETSSCTSSSCAFRRGIEPWRYLTCQLVPVSWYLTFHDLYIDIQV